MSRPMRSRHASASIAALRRNLAEILNRVAYACETIVLTRHGRRIAGIVPIQEALAKSLEKELGLSD